MEAIKQYIQAPSKLQSVLNYCVELSDINKQKVCLIQDIARMAKLMKYPPMSEQTFEEFYNMSILHLEVAQYAVTIELNTYMYKQPLQGADF
jgi:hypothetical protein